MYTLTTVGDTYFLINGARVGTQAIMWPIQSSKKLISAIVPKMNTKSGFVADACVAWIRHAMIPTVLLLLVKKTRVTAVLTVFQG